MKVYKVLVAGGGIGGLTLALCLAQKGHRVVVFEQASEFSEVGAGIQLSPNCSRVLHNLALEDPIRRSAFLPEGTQFRSWRTGKVIAESALGESVLAEYGAPYYHIHRGDLLRVLLDAAQGLTNVELIASAKVDSFSQSDNGVVLKVGEREYPGDVLVGADGIHSVVRDCLWGKHAPDFTGNVAWRALVPVSKLPAGLIRPMSTAWWGPGKHFVHYYVRGGEFVNCVCVVEKEGWQVESWSERGDLHELKADFKGWHKDVQQLIDNADQDSLFKWALFDRAPMSQWGKGRVTLLGDACHPTLPFMAQGAAMAIEDAAVLAGCLSKGEGIPASLQRYEDLRRDRTASIQNGSRRNAKVFHMSGVAAWFRNRAAAAAGGRTMRSLFSYNALSVADESTHSTR